MAPSILSTLLLTAICSSAVNAAPTGSGPIVDLGYASYEGIANTSTGLNTFKGVRFAAPPTGENRWRAPLPPANTNQTADSPLPAFERATRCPQSQLSPYIFDPCPGLQTETTLPARCANSTAFRQMIQGDEDCLFLDVYAPQQAQGLPVFVWIHGGGYGADDSSTGDDQSELLNVNNNSFIGVSIQYRLGAFGFLSSDEVKRGGAVNAGLLDMLFALEWVQQHISKFGGDPSKVTIGGESAGGGAVMLLDTAYGGTLGDRLWQNSIATSPYLPKQYGYADFAPSQAYYAFAATVGCFDGTPFGNASASVLACLRGKDTQILQQASAIVSASTTYGQWAFVPVTDGEVLRERPSAALAAGAVNGRAVLTANNANEGMLFTPPEIATDADFRAWMRELFPLFTDADLAALYAHYPAADNSTSSNNASAPLFATNGLTGPTAVTQSTFASGAKQRAMDIYAETTFVCPSYWLASAFAAPGAARSAHRYQYSVIPAQHGVEVPFFFGPRPQTWSPAFQAAVFATWGNLITAGAPGLTAAQAGNDSGTAAAAASAWPAWDPAAPRMLNLNQTGGVPVPFATNVTGTVADGLRTTTYRATQFAWRGGAAGPDGPLRSDFAVVDAAAWEGGRGARCDFWRDVSPRVPE